MNLYVKNSIEDYNDFISLTIINIIKTKLKNKDRVVLSIPTEPECESIYLCLAKKIKESDIDLKRLYIFEQTEYVGLSKDNVKSNSYFIDKNFLSLLDIPKENIFLFDGLLGDEQMDYMTAKLKEFGVIDLLWYSLTRSTKVAGNERLSSISALYRLKTIDNIESEDVVDNNLIAATRVFSMGMGFSYMADIILLSVSGVSNSLALKECLEGGIGHLAPISIIQEHKDVIVIADREASLRLDTQMLSISAK